MSVVRLTFFRHTLDETNAPEIRKFLNIDRMPLAPTEVSVEFKDVLTVYVNAFRRVLTTESFGYALQVPPDGLNTELTTDCFMLPQFVNERISGMALPSQIPADIVSNLRLKLDVTNNTASPLTVYSGDLEISAGTMPEPLFNPTADIAFLQPGKRIVIDGIYISPGYGSNSYKYVPSGQSGYTHLDIEQYTDEEMRDEKGIAADQSGYKISSLVANPRHHI